MANHRHTTRSRRPSRPHGAVLLEVILSLSLLVAASSVILGGLNNCARQLEDIRLEGTGADLAISLMSQIEMGLLDPADEGPVSYESPLEQWSWQVVTQSLDPSTDEPPLKQVEVIVRYTPEAPGRAYTYRLVQLLGGASGDELLALGAGGAGTGGTR